MNNKIKVAVIGAGFIAHRHLEVIKKIKKFKLIAITSRTYNKAKKIADKYDIQNVHTNLNEMVLKNNIDCILVLVSAENMFTTIKKVINLKIPFFFEKPAGLNFKETKHLAQLAKKKKVKNMVGLNRRFYSVFESGMKILKKRGGFKGLLIEGHERFWKIEKKINPKIYKNWLYANSIHTIDLLRFFGGEIKKIKSFSCNNGFSKNFTLAIKFKNNSIGTYVSNWNSPAGWSVTIFGDGYTIKYKPLEVGILIDKKFNKKFLKKSTFDRIYKPGFYKQMLEFKKFINSGKLTKPAQDLDGLLRSVSIIKKIK